MSVGRLARGGGPERARAVRRLARARRRHDDLVAARPDALERLSGARAAIASREIWLHWLERNQTPEPWADGEWDTTRSAAWTMPAEAPSVAVLRDRMVAFARASGAGEQIVADVQLAVSEAFTNVVMHAFRGGRPAGTVSAGITLDRTSGRLTVTVVDDGVGLTPRSDSPGFGLGLPIIAEVTEAMTVRPGPDGVGTHVRMTFADRRAASRARERRLEGPSSPAGSGRALRQ